MQRYFTDKKEKNSFLLNDNDLYHIYTVMRMHNDDLIEVVYNKELYICKLVDKNIEIVNKCEDKVDNYMEKVLIIPLLTESKMDYILQKGTELGVDRIIPVRMNRSKIIIDNNKEAKKIERWYKICKEAAEQSKRLDIPTIDNIRDFKYLETLDGAKIVCSTNNCQSIKKFLTNNKNCDRLIMVVGPEGGLDKKEEDYLISIGFEAVSFGKNILRAETAPLYLLSILNYEFME